MTSRRIPLTLLAALSLLACREPAPPDPRLVGQWVRASHAFIRSERIGPPVTARMNAYGSLALYEGYAADPSSRLRSLAGQLNGLWSVPIAPRDRPVDGATVAAEAERVVLDSLYSEGSQGTRRAIDSLASAQIASRRAAGVRADEIERSVNHGRALGRVIIAWAVTDGFLSTRERRWSPPRSVTQWVNTAPTDQAGARPRSEGVGIVLAGRDARPAATTLPRFDPTQPTEPHWGTLRAFALRNGDECAPPRPPEYSEHRGSEFWKMGKELYDSVSNLTDEKRSLALFWGGDPIAAAEPALRWINVVDQMIARRHLTADQAAEAYALTSVAIADAFIGSWKQKYRSMVVRPVTYVQRVFSPKWQPVSPTPPFPEYPSDHAALSGAATEVLTRLLGDSIAFTDTAQMPTGPRTRSFRNFTHARDEVVLATVYGGIHFVPSAVNGLAQGQCIGQRVLGRLRTR